jgi:hypothetical protein
MICGEGEKKEKKKKKKSKKKKWALFKVEGSTSNFPLLANQIKGGYRDTCDKLIFLSGGGRREERRCCLRHCSIPFKSTTVSIQLQKRTS